MNIVFCKQCVSLYLTIYNMACHRSKIRWDKEDIPVTVFFMFPMYLFSRSNLRNYVAFPLWHGIYKSAMYIAVRSPGTTLVHLLYFFETTIEVWRSWQPISHPWRFPMCQQYNTSRLERCHRSLYFRFVHVIKMKWIGLHATFVHI